jgi:hypothetical protein
MTPFDDNDLIDRLKSAIAEHQSGITAPEGMGDAARQAARRRTAKRAVGAGVPVLAAAGVATVLAISSGSGSPAAGGQSADSSALSAPTAPFKAQDTAYIIKRVKAKVADDIQEGMVIHSYSYASGDDADGSLLKLGQKNEDGYEYTAPDGSVFNRAISYAMQNGSPVNGLDSITIDDLSPQGNGKYDDSRTRIDSGSQTYSQDHFSGLSNPNATSLPNLYLFSSAAEVQQALQSGQMTQTGTATVNGTPAIALSVKVPSGSSEIMKSASGTDTVSTDLTLYVDAHTYQPLRTVLGLGGTPGLLVSDWVPATPENIAQATNASIPTGYTTVDDSH